MLTLNKGYILTNMAMNRANLSPKDRQMLSALAEKSQDEALRVAVSTYLERSGKSAEPNGAPKSDADREQAFLEAAGGWADMDVDTWLEEIYTQRLQPSRPAPEL